MIMPAANNEFAPVIKRLQETLIEYLNEGKSLGIKFDRTEVVAAIDRAIAKLNGANDEARRETPKEFFLDGVTELLLEEREGVFEKQKDGNGEEKYLAVSVAVWAQCLGELRKITHS
jgi:parvulin-like peptidyl-prolyl isomerase